MAITSCARCLEAPCRNVLEHACSLPPPYILLSSIPLIFNTSFASFLCMCFSYSQYFYFIADMFELIINEYLGNTMCKDWTIIGMLKYIESKSEISTDIIETLKTEIYSALQNFRDSHNIHIHENAKKKARKILTSFDKSFSSVNVNNFINELELKDERRGFHLAVRRNVTSSSTLQALEEHHSTRKEIEEIRNTNENEVAISVDDESGQGNEKEKVTQENVRKRSYAEVDNLYSFSNEPSAYVILTMEKYCKKQTTSKFDLAHSFILDLTSESQIEKEFEPKLWAELIADRPATIKSEYHKEIESICDHLFGPLCKKKQPKLYESRDKWENLRNLKAPEYNNDFSYEKEDWKKILYWAERAVGP
ncbi:7150_t:CDS:2, partial [Acaulospora colombiana]